MKYRNTRRRSVHLALLVLSPLVVAACASTDVQKPTQAPMRSETDAVAPLENMQAQIVLRTEPEVATEPTGALDPISVHPAQAVEPATSESGAESELIAVAPTGDDAQGVADAQTQSQSVEPLSVTSTPTQRVFRFGFDRAELKAEDQLVLREHAAYLLHHPEASVSVRGHTDSSGDARYNQLLSERRARYVADRLAEAGVPRAQIQIEGLGDSEPLALATEPRDHRRVELRYQENYLVDSR